MKANENLRHDPVVNSKVREMLTERNAVIDELAPVVEQLEAIARKFPHRYVGDNSTILADRVLSQITRLRYELERYSAPDPDNETYVGNLSAFEYGSVFGTVTEK